MSEVIFATGEEIYAAAVAGAERGYNRSTDEHQTYERILGEHYETLLNNVSNIAERRRIQKRTGNDWRKAYLPLSMALVHQHVRGEPCEAHARVYLTSNRGRIFDIPMAHWEEMSQSSKRVFP